MTNRRTLIVDRLGDVDAARLSEIVGGSRLHVPGQLKNAARLKRLLGDDLAIRVVLHFGDSRMYVPKPQRANPVDVKAVARLTNRGLNARDIAAKLGCCDRTVHAKRALARERGLLREPQA